MQNDGVAGPSTSKMPPPANKQLPRTVAKSSSPVLAKPSSPHDNTDLLTHQAGASAFVSVNPISRFTQEMVGQLVQKPTPTLSAFAGQQTLGKPHPPYQRPVSIATPQPQPSQAFNAPQVCLLLDGLLSLLKAE